MIDISNITDYKIAVVAVKFVPKAEISKVCDSKAISLWPPKVVEYFKS